MDEQFRMLGRERQADLDREARRFALADLVKRERVARQPLRPSFFRRVASMLVNSGRGSRQAKPDPTVTAPPLSSVSPKSSL
jgi:hypothetical protein